MNDSAKLIDALAHLLGVLAWPLVIAILAICFSPAISNLIPRVDSFSFKGLGVEAQATIAKVQTALVDAEARKDSDQTKGASTHSIAGSSKPSAVVLNQAINDLTNSRILWVDDNPSNNSFEIKAFNEAGAIVQTALSTEAALSKLGHGRYDAIISDMARPPDDRAGYTLLSALGENHPPYFIYTGSSDPKYNEEAISKGAVGSTSSPTRLLRLVATAIAYDRLREN